MKKYCSECKLPLADPNVSTCDKCGKPTRPMDIFERIASDDLFSSKEKKFLSVLGVMDIVACVIEVIWMVFAISVIFEAFANSGLDLGFVETGYTRIETWLMNLLINLFILLMNFLKWGPVFVGVISIVEQLVTLFFNVMMLLKKAWAVHACRVLCIVNVVLYISGGNLISSIIGLCVSIKLDRFFSKVERGAEFNRRTENVIKRTENVIKASEVAADKAVWRCNSCGYVNPALVSECRFCGKWKV